MRGNMATDPYTWRSIWTSVVIGCCLVAVACAAQAAFAPTVRVTCPARSSAPPDCQMRWLVGFDLIPVRNTPLPGLQSAGEVVESNPGSGSSSTGPNRRFASAGAYTVYLQTAAGPVRTIMWGNQMELQWFREPIVKYLETPDASALAVTMWPSAHPMRKIANGIIVVAVLFWVWLPFQIAGVLRRSAASYAAG